MNADRTSDLARRAAVHAALADPARLRITDTLLAGDASPSELAAMLAMPSNLLAHHLHVLEQAGIITRRRSEGDRRRTYLQLIPGALDSLAPPPARTARRVLFVCTANSARSHLAAALWRQASNVPAVSAGTHPARRSTPARSPPPDATGCCCPGCGPATSARSSKTATWWSRSATWPTRNSAGQAAVHWSVPDPVPAGDPAQLRRGASRPQPPRRASRAAPGRDQLDRAAGVASGPGRGGPSSRG